MLFLFRGLLDFCCPKIPFYWETIFHLVFLDKEFFYLKWLLNKILCFKKEKKKISASGFDELLESIFFLLLVVEVFSLQKVVEMLEEVIFGWQEVR